jgi:hypothetical protein
MTESLLKGIQPLCASTVADTDTLWTAFEESSFFAVTAAEKYYVPYLSALYTPGYFFAAEDQVTMRAPFSAVGQSLPRFQLSLVEAKKSWFVALWLPCTGDADALLSESMLVFYGLSPMTVHCILPYARTPPDAVQKALTIVNTAGVRVPDLDLFILRSS